MKGGVQNRHMQFVYLLQSQIDQTFYIGIAANIDNRLVEHNQGSVYYTSRKKPWNVVYFEAYVSRDLACERERQLKRFGSAYTALLKRLQLR